MSLLINESYDHRCLCEMLMIAFVLGSYSVVVIHPMEVDKEYKKKKIGDKSVD